MWIAWTSESSNSWTHTALLKNVLLKLKKKKKKKKTKKKKKKIKKNGWEKKRKQTKKHCPCQNYFAPLCVKKIKRKKR